MVFRLTLLAMLALVSASAQTSQVQVMSFNIRYPNPDDGANFWPQRKEMVASTIRFHEADLVGLQEAFKIQLDELQKLLPDFAVFGVSRTDGTENPNPDNEFSAILYRRDRFVLVDGGTFWLSEHPEKVGVAGWDAALPRIVTWAKFKDQRTGKMLFHFNTHFDHKGKKARKNSAALIRTKITEIAGNAAVVLTGDFNCRPEDKPYEVLTAAGQGQLLDAFHESEMPHHGPDGTWTNSFKIAGVPGQRIDYIFVKNEVKVLKHAALSDSWGGRLPSDHLPVLAKIEF